MENGERSVQESQGQPAEPSAIGQATAVDGALEEFQPVDRSVPPQKWESIPAPIKYFGYFFIALILLIMIFCLATGLLK